MSAMRGGLGGPGLGGGTLGVYVRPDEVMQHVPLHDFVIMKTMDVSSVK